MKGLNREVSRIGLGTWSIGGFMWGGTDEQEALKTIRTAVEHGISLIDTAPVYGLGRAEEIVGRALAQYGKREEVIIATKVGLEWRGEQVFRNSTRARIMKEIDDSLRRLKPITSTFIKFIGRTLLFQFKRQRPRCISFINKGRSGPSG